MAVIVLRTTKGSPLTIAEADANFSNLNTEVGSKLDSALYTAADVLTKIKTVDGSGSGLDADTVDGFEQSTTNTVSTLVRRDSSGNFAAGTITATSFVGNLTGNVTGAFTGSLSGNANNVTGIVALENGGTGANTAANARTALGLGNIATQASNSVTITGGTISGITDLALADGGTGASTAAQARTNLGLVVGLDVQGYSAELVSLSALTTTGLIVRTGSGTTTRSLTAGTNIGITNNTGVSGNITIDGSTTPTVSQISKSGTDGTGDIGQAANRFGTIYGTATSAKYADLAEKYTTDQEYDPGTVIVVASAGDTEGTASYTTGQRVLGVVSTNPAFIMNDELDGQAIALRGRVPVKVVGPIRKGQALICNQDGKGIYGDTSNSFAIALETNEEHTVKLVECVIL
jgi:hypothetical protein